MLMYDAIVIGAGFAGLRTARDLRDAGKTVLVLEARDRLGGRTYYDYLDGIDQKVELGGTWIMPKFQPNVAAELERYGLSLSSSPEPAQMTWHFGDETVTGGFPIPFDQITEFERSIALIVAESKRITFGVPFEEQGLEDLDIPLSDWLDKHGVSGHTREIINSYGAALCFGVAPENISALHAISWVTGSGNSAWELFLGPTIKFADGTASLYNRLAEGLEVMLSTPVSAVTQADGRVDVTTADGQVLQGKSAVVAVPLNTWKNIAFSPALSAEKEAFTREELAGHDVKLWAQVRGIPKFSAALGWNTPLQWLSAEFERDEGSILCGFAFDQTQMDPTDRTSVERAIRAYFPEAEIVAWWSEDWNGSPYSMGTWTAFRPGQITRYAAASRAAEGLLSFATADVAVGFSGWIEGALESGATAAKETLAKLA